MIASDWRPSIDWIVWVSIKDGYWEPTWEHSWIILNHEEDHDHDYHDGYDDHDKDHGNDYQWNCNYTRSLGAPWATPSSWKPIGPLDFVLRALRALRQ